MDSELHARAIGLMLRIPEVSQVIVGEVAEGGEWVVANV
jgi:hypothetical protein